MNRADRPDADRIHHLMMAALDGELERGERDELEREIAQNPGFKSEWDRLARVKEVTETMSLQSPPDEVWQSYWTSVYSRIERGIGWILLSLGAIVLLSYGAWRMVEGLIASDAPWFVKGALLSLLVGIVILVVSVVREKIFTQRRDRYKEVMQ